MNEEIFSIIESYIRKSNTDYGVMITGPWGCGKSYFWKNSIRPVIESLTIDSSEESEKFRVIYISLNGIVSKDEIISQIISYSFVEHKAGKITWDILNVITESSEKIKLLGEIGKKITVGTIESLINPANTVLCFDDLERSRMDIQALLGYINTTFVEHHHYKVIFIADEEKVEYGLTQTADQGEDSDPIFESIKEKIIGRTVRFRFDLDAIINQVCRQFEEPSELFMKFIESNMGLISMVLRNEMHVYQVSDENQNRPDTRRVENIRTIRFALEMLREIYIREPSKPLFGIHGKELIVFVLMIAIEHKENRLLSEDHRDNKGIPQMENTMMMQNVFGNSNPTSDQSKKESNPRTEYISYLHTRYYGTSLIDALFIQGIYEFILTGFYDERIIMEQVSNYLGVPEPSYVKAFHKLNQGKALEDDDFIEAADTIIQSIKDNKWGIYDYPNLYTQLDQYISADIFDYNQKDLFELVLAAINNSITSSTYNPEWNYQKGMFLAEMGENDLLKKIYQAVSDADLVLGSRIEREHFSDLFDSINKGGEFDRKLINQIISKPILSIIGTVDLMKFLKSCTNNGIRRFMLFMQETKPYAANPDIYKYDPKLLDSFIKIIDTEIGNLDKKRNRKFEFSRLKQVIIELKKQ
ncbi:P-loop NTPase fold protein [Candidatus Neomarinimicrobiota bacterium]